MRYTNSMMMMNWLSLKPLPTRPGHVKLPLVIVITAVDFDQFSLYSTGTSLFSNDHK